MVETCYTSGNATALANVTGAAPGKSADTAQPRPVQLDYTAGDRAVVRGVQPGERIVLEGKQNLRPGSRVRVERPVSQGAAAASASTVQRNPT